jgi:CDP-diacylglycerol--glycerol-3-phosphate 3-phosphatidyltransferase
MASITPNQLTLFRIAVVPVIALLICMQSTITAALALVVFVAAAATDWYDGYLARKTNNTTLFGRIFDANADKLLIIGCLFAFAFNQQLSNGLIFPALVIVFREIFVSGLREYVAINTSVDNEEDEAVKATRGLQSSDLAKIKTGVQMLAVALLIPSASYVRFLHPYLGGVAGLFLWGAAALSAYTGWQYWKVVKFTPEKDSL